MFRRSLYWAQALEYRTSCEMKTLYAGDTEKEVICALVQHLSHFMHFCVGTKKIIIHSFWSTFVKDLKRNFSCKIHKKIPHKSTKIGFFDKTRLTYDYQYDVQIHRNDVVSGTIFNMCVVLLKYSIELNIFSFCRILTLLNGKD
jgi:hypothetical protein